MNPYLVLGLSPEAGDEEAEARYREMAERFPPDVCPIEFSLIRRAYEMISDERRRIETLLFHFDSIVGVSMGGSREHTKAVRRDRIPPEQLALLLRGGRDELP